MRAVAAVVELIFALPLALSGARSDSWACLKSLQVSLHLFGIFGLRRSHQDAKVNAPTSLLDTFGRFAGFSCYRPKFSISGNAESRLTIRVQKETELSLHPQQLTEGTRRSKGREVEIVFRRSGRCNGRRTVVGLGSNTA